MGSIFDRPGLRYISHRGFRPVAPDNSLPGFECAGRLGQWAIETDVHRSADGVLVCCHNDTVEATFDGTGAIRDRNWEQLQKLQMNKGPRLDQFTREQKRMPLFSEYLAICRRFGSVPFIELKTDDVEPVIRAVREAGFSECRGGDELHQAEPPCSDPKSGSGDVSSLDLCPGGAAGRIEKSG